MIDKTLIALMFASAFVLTACEKEADTYPVSGEQCGPEDPVKQLDADDCFIPPAGI
ncbi:MULTISPECIES: hypothetical protein [unclassified Ruegeria]|uniref:hypothetical protein n=1 Tax=unclassified Ruegeria TaxID=2625375 RepID=UPI00148767A3|nr:MULTISPECIES: hypothetical protein [unclassified Ruegeria]